MGRNRIKDTGIGYEPIKARITKTEDGYPVDLKTAREAYGSGVVRAPEEGWFWIFATAKSAEGIRRRGLKAVGTVATTFAPPQIGPSVAHDPYELALLEAETPVSGTQAHIDAMIAETHGG